MRISELFEKVERIPGANPRKEIDCLRSPTKKELAAANQKWRGRLRALIDLTTDTIYVCDAYEIYHYQMIQNLGLDKDNVVGFHIKGGNVGVYVPKGFKEGDPLPPYLQTELPQIQNSKALKRLLGPNFGIVAVDPD